MLTTDRQHDIYRYFQSTVSNRKYSVSRGRSFSTHSPTVQCAGFCICFIMGRSCFGTAEDFYQILALRLCLISTCPASTNANVCKNPMRVRVNWGEKKDTTQMKNGNALQWLAVTFLLHTKFLSPQRRLRLPLDSPENDQQRTTLGTACPKVL